MKELKVRQATGDGTAISRMYEIHYVGGGEVPDVLKGYFTSYSTGNDAIAKWKLSNKDRLQAKAIKEDAMAALTGTIENIQKERKEKNTIKHIKEMITRKANKKD